jgi:hypothetical protein
MASASTPAAAAGEHVCLEMLGEGRRLVDAARFAGVTQRPFGGLAVREHCRTAQLCARDYSDLDTGCPDRHLVAGLALAASPALAEHPLRFAAHGRVNILADMNAARRMTSLATTGGTAVVGYDSATRGAPLASRACGNLIVSVSSVAAGRRRCSAATPRLPSLLSSSPLAAHPPLPWAFASEEPAEPLGGRVGESQLDGEAEVAVSPTVSRGAVHQPVCGLERRPMLVDPRARVESVAGDGRD